MAIDGLEWAITPSQNFKGQFEGWGKFCGSGQAKSRMPEEWVPVAESLAAEHGGVLPHIKWLENNDYNALHKAMRRRPEMFVHVSQTFIYNTTKKQGIRVNGQITSIQREVA